MMFNPFTPPVAGLKRGAHVLVTGASSGIGLGLVRQLVANQHVATVTAVSRHAVASAPLAELRGRCDRDRLHTIDADLTDEADTAAMAERVRARHDRLHLVVNAAGMLHDGASRPKGRSINSPSTRWLVLSRSTRSRRSCSAAR